MSEPKTKAAALSKCPLNGCERRPEPIFCATHWGNITTTTRREIVREFKALSGRGIGNIPKRLGELLAIAVQEAA